MPEPDSTDYEHRDIHPRAVMWCAIALAAALIVIFVAIRLFEKALTHRYAGDATRILSPQIEPPPPRLQTNPAADLAKFRGDEDAKLHSYGWIDRRAGIIRIPIERAIDLTAERGLPMRTEKKGAAK